MASLLWLVLPVLALAGLAAVIFVGYSDAVGTKAQRRRRHEEVLRSFDGRPEARVRVSGTGLSPAQTAWLGHQYGYAVQNWETGRHKPRYLVMRRVTPGPAGPVPVPEGWTGAPGPAAPVPVSDEQLRAELRRAPDPVARRNQLMALLLFGAGSVVAAVDNYRSGDAYLLPTLAAVVFLTGAATLTWFRRRADRQRRATPPPVDPRQGYMR
ncbi:hypothetical protein [Streptomyces pinistramenti]|uniref:hypothetical protein n=1 Tax=Streptomyces pinistramenti TaxID=2884812 RepID=UPI001D0659E5|nr:hypothetical protein [Streptomyces pinistramenti]MCB5909730.1 hypothetical protein [Streptomyces pinistramenti]